MKNENPYGDDAGTRIGRPDTPQRDNVTGGNLEGGGDGGDLGAGKEATGGMSQHGNPNQADKPSSVPKERNEEHESGYGGDHDNPKSSSDTR